MSETLTTPKTRYAFIFFIIWLLVFWPTLSTRILDVRNAIVAAVRRDHSKSDVVLSDLRSNSIDVTRLYEVIHNPYRDDLVVKLNNCRKLYGFDIIAWENILDVDPHRMYTLEDFERIVALRRNTFAQTLEEYPLETIINSVKLMDCVMEENPHMVFDLARNPTCNPMKNEKLIDSIKYEDSLVLPDVEQHVGTYPFAVLDKPQLVYYGYDGMETPHTLIKSISKTYTSVYPRVLFTYDAANAANIPVNLRYLREFKDNPKYDIAYVVIKTNVALHSTHAAIVYKTNEGDGSIGFRIFDGWFYAKDSKLKTQADAVLQQTSDSYFDTKLKRADFFKTQGYNEGSCAAVAISKLLFMVDNKSPTRSYDELMQVDVNCQYQVALSLVVNMMKLKAKEGRVVPQFEALAVSHEKRRNYETLGRDSDKVFQILLQFMTYYKLRTAEVVAFGRSVKKTLDERMHAFLYFAKRYAQIRRGQNVSLSKMLGKFLKAERISHSYYNKRASKSRH